MADNFTIKTCYSWKQGLSQDWEFTSPKIIISISNGLVYKWTTERKMCSQRPEAPNGWGTGACHRAPGGGQVGKAPWSSKHFSKFGSKFYAYFLPKISLELFIKTWFFKAKNVTWNHKTCENRDFRPKSKLYRCSQKWLPVHRIL